MYEIIDNTQHINAFHMPQCSTTRPRCCMPVISLVLVFPIAFFLYHDSMIISKIMLAKPKTQLIVHHTSGKLSGYVNMFHHI